MKKYNLLIVEDETLTRQSLVYSLKKYEDINVVNALKNGQEAVDFIKENQTDVILMDIDMPVMNGIEATEIIKKINPGILIIILTAHSEKEKVLSAFSSGANGYCVKQIKINELINVIKIVNDGGVWFDKQIASYIYEIINDSNSKNKKQSYVLNDEIKITESEYKVIELIAEGLSNKEISEKLVISTNTVKNHVANIIKKLAVKDRTQIAVFAYKNNLLK